MGYSSINTYNLNLARLFCIITIEENMSVNSLPFLTISKNLTGNCCWLCEQTFPRGLTKKVFQVQNLLDYFQKRYALEREIEAQKAQLSDTVAVEGGDTSASETITLPAIRTRNFADCYRYFKTEMDNHGNIEGLIKELRENDLDVWMSGLICALHGGCASDSCLFIETLEKPSLPTQKKKGGIPIGITFANKDCPPNCGCDNPWAFLA